MTLQGIGERVVVEKSAENEITYKIRHDMIRQRQQGGKHRNVTEGRKNQQVARPAHPKSYECSSI